jgi:hypothetical protein
MANKLETEIAFGEFLIKIAGGEVEYSPEIADMFDHWDVRHTDKIGRVTLFDVKATPNKKSVPYKNNMRWCEVSNVRGDAGWLNGKADYIAFEDDSHWIFVNREKLLKQVTILTSGNTFKGEFKTKPVPYRWHTREGRDDLVTLVPVADLISLGVLIQKK